MEDNEERVFSRSMYASNEDLLEAKANYYEGLYRELLTSQTDTGSEVTLHCGVSKPDFICRRR